MRPSGLIFKQGISYPTHAESSIVCTRLQEYEKGNKYKKMERNEETEEGD
jgi:hypothetical protein